ncbi:PTS fructose transporter subunit IIB [Halopelagius longus]|uniref:PTS sugar transporter subunit IIC n=1 Tax=Halopelagius longus TaxID=1236180 RepID=A0A1H1AQH1_9EURY|nr:PTS fructose transporter subunit IIB [Halopelagius longus]RDI70480.1 PTS sugar transporter subunit IIC [Halopelagius longus]SDQ42023.1 PTS system, fructose-specific IIB component [Halopelagius longus]
MKLVAVTSCPTGIAHSQMAAENLEQTADRLGHDIKVEVQGAMGAENELSGDDIAGADAVIVASDTSVSRDRFEGKPLVKGTVKDGVNDPEGLIEQAAELVESGESGTVELGDAADGDADSAGEPAADPAPQQQRRGGDREKGLFARLKKLFS